MTVAPSLSAETRRRARHAVRPVADRVDLAERLRPFEPLRWRPEADAAPTLQLDDVSAIPFLQGVSGVELYQHRARIRARDRDLFAAVAPVVDSYETYCQEILDLGRPEFVLAEREQDPLAVARSCGRGEAFDRLAARAEAEGLLAIHPYMGIEDVWYLGKDLAEASGADIRVLAPPPPVTWIANDKALFSDVVERVLGPEWIVETHFERESEKIAKRLVDAASRHEKVGLKRTRCASAMGNRVYEASEIRRLDEHAARLEVQSFLDRTEWDGREEILIVAWEETDISPSTQLWIPPDGHGTPRVDGIYEQLLEGEEKVFLGSRMSTLPDAVNATMANASLLIAEAFQALGYVGRCSFDLLVLGDPEGEFIVRFTECNGRWGGTSTPMHLLDRLVRGRPRPPYRAQDFVHPDLVGVDFDELYRRLGDAVYDPRTGEGRYVLYNVGPLESAGKFDVISIAETQDEAEDALHEDLPRRLGLD